MTGTIVTPVGAARLGQSAAELRVRPAGADDPAGLAPALGEYWYFQDRFLRQEEDRGCLITAWLGDQAVGVVFLWLDRPEEPDIREYLGDVPLLTHLEVLEACRGRGIGSVLVRAVEDRVRELGHDRLALAVRTDNSRAEALYRRLGYELWGHGVIECRAERTLADGRVVSEYEKCHVLVKQPLGRS